MNLLSGLATRAHVESTFRSIVAFLAVSWCDTNSVISRRVANITRIIRGDKAEFVRVAYHARESTSRLCRLLCPEHYEYRIIIYLAGLSRYFELLDII